MNSMEVWAENRDQLALDSDIWIHFRMVKFCQFVANYIICLLMCSVILSMFLFQTLNKSVFPIKKNSPINFTMTDYEELLKLPKLSTNNRSKRQLWKTAKIPAKWNSIAIRSIHSSDSLYKSQFINCIWGSNRKENLLDTGSFEAKPLIEWRCLLLDRIAGKSNRKNKISWFHGPSSFFPKLDFFCFVLIWLGSFWCFWYQWVVLTAVILLKSCRRFIYFDKLEKPSCF